MHLGASYPWGLGHAQLAFLKPASSDGGGHGRLWLCALLGQVVYTGQG